MSNFEDFDNKYLAILKKIDLLRNRGVTDLDPEMRKTKMALRDLLELKKRNITSIQKVVPRLTGVKTVSIASKQLGGQPDLLHNKYVMMGVALAICALIYFYFNPDFYRPSRK